MSAPSLWAMAWTIINCALQALDDAGRDRPTDIEVGSGGIDSLCCDGLFANITNGGRITHPDGCTALATGVIELVLVRPCIARGINPDRPSRAYDPGVPPPNFDPSTWLPPLGTWHYDQYGVLADLDALLPAIATIKGPGGDGLFITGPVASMDSWAPYLTGDQGRCQGWQFNYRPTTTR